jgi:molybdopterin converting factor small subunit
MAVRVHVPEVLRRATGGIDEIPSSGASVGAALDGAFAAHPRLRTLTLDADGRVFPYLVLFVNGREVARDAALAAPVKDGDVVEIVGAAEGG